MADETLVYTILGEARGEGVEGMVGVANVIRNRADAGGLFPTDPVDVALQPWQFSTNNPGEGGNQAQTRREAPVGSALYNTAARIVDLYIEGDNPPTDLTGGSLYYHVTGLPWQYANAVTTRYGTTTIGNHTFYPRQPLPQIDIGSVDLLRGAVDATPPVPMNRGSRPGGYTTTSAQEIAMVREESRYQRRVAQLRSAMNDARLAASSRGAGVVDEGIGVTPILQDDGSIVDTRPKMEMIFDRERMSWIDVNTRADDIMSPNAGPRAPALGFGSLLGKAFPMVPPSQVQAEAARPKTIAELNGGKPAPGITLPVVRGALRPGDVVAESGLIRRSVKTVRIDPMTGMPVLDSEIGPMPAKVSVAPKWTGDPAARVKAAQEAARLQRSLPGLPLSPGLSSPAFMTEAERVRFDAQQKRGADLIANGSGLTPPGGNLTAAQRAAISGSGAPVPRPAGARDTAPPIPRPASDRPKSTYREPLPVPAPLTFPQRPKSVLAPLPASTDSLTKIMAPKTSVVRAPLKLTAAPIGHGRITAPAAQKIDRTVVVRSDGTEVVVPRAGSVAMPADARPSIVPKPATSKPITPSWTAPKVSTATVQPQKPVAPVLSAPGAGLTPAQRAAISGSGAPVPAVKPASLANPPPSTPISPKTVTTAPKVATPKPAVPKISSGGGSSTVAKPAPVTARGTASKTIYTVGSKVSNGNGTYVVGKDSKGNATFTRL